MDILLEDCVLSYKYVKKYKYDQNRNVFQYDNFECKFASMLEFQRLIKIYLATKNLDVAFTTRNEVFIYSKKLFEIELNLQLQNCEKIFIGPSKQFNQSKIEKFYLKNGIKLAKITHDERLYGPTIVFIYQMNEQIIGFGNLVDFGYTVIRFLIDKQFRRQRLGVKIFSAIELYANKNFGCNELEIFCRTEEERFFYKFLDAIEIGNVAGYFAFIKKI